MITTPEGIRIARRFKKALEENGIYPQSVVLFGSVAKGTTREWSDIDIAVVLPQGAHKKSNMWPAVRDTDLRIEPVALTPEALDDRYSTLAREIRTYGISVQ